MSESYDERLSEYPASLALSLTARTRWRREISELAPDLAFLVSDLDRWATGVPVTVAFRGGDPRLHRRIAEAVAPLAKSCALTLDFGIGQDGRFRTWSTDDREYGACIRVGFDQPGFWSLIGTASIDPTVGRPSDGNGGHPHQQTMNLGGFDQELPLGWRRTVLRQFLHAVGLAVESEDTNGLYQDQFRWDDDQWYVPTTDRNGHFVADTRGRRPGIYTYLSGPPNHWGRQKVDDHLRVPGANTIRLWGFDPESVLYYRFPPFFYRSFPNPIAPTTDGQTLSRGDKCGLEMLYPFDPTSAQELAERAKRASIALEGVRCYPSDGREATTKPSHSCTQLGNNAYFGSTFLLLERLSTRSTGNDTSRLYEAIHKSVRGEVPKRA